MKAHQGTHPRGAFFLAGVLVLGLAACALPARADDGGIENVGGAARLLTDQGHIRMLAETVRARVSQDSIEVNCEFTFVNHGPADTVLIGFPVRSSGADVCGDCSDESMTIQPMTGFRSWVDGVEVECTAMPDAEHTGEQEYAYWWTKSVPFAAGQTRVIRDYYIESPGYDSMDGRSFAYILETGASWAGTIGSAEIIVTMVGFSSSSIASMETKPRIRGQELRWSFRNFEPGVDGPASIGFRWIHPGSWGYWDHFVSELKRAVQGDDEEAGSE